jgi:hypothetical protein
MIGYPRFEAEAHLSSGWRAAGRADAAWTCPRVIEALRTRFAFLTSSNPGIG